MSQGCACTTYQFTTFCQLWTKLDKCESECNVIAMIIFFLCHKMLLLLMLEKPNAIVSIALQPRNLVIVLKFMILRLLAKSCQIQDTPAREESLELYTYFHPLFRLVNNKIVSWLVFANITGTFWVERRKDQCLHCRVMFLLVYFWNIIFVTFCLSLVNKTNSAQWPDSDKSVISMEFWGCERPGETAALIHVGSWDRH